MDEPLKHLQNQWIELVKDMDSLASDQAGFVTSTRKACSS